MILILQLSAFEIIEKCATIVIALSSLGFSLYIWRYQTNKDNKNLKLDWYKTIIIETKFGDFFKYFETIQRILNDVYNNTEMTDDDKIQANTDIGEEFTKFRQDFISLLLSVDKMLFLTVKKQFDDLYDGITIKLFDEALDLSDITIFQEELLTPISNYKSNVLSIFVNFKGNNDSHKVKKC